MQLRNAIILVGVFLGTFLVALGLPQPYRPSGTGVSILVTAVTYGWLARRRS